MMAEYAHYYGAPDGSMAWPLFQSLVARTERFEARANLTLYDSVSAAIGRAFSDKSDRAARMQLVARAYPLKRKAPEWHPNMFAPGAQEPADA